MCGLKRLFLLSCFLAIGVGNAGATVFINEVMANNKTIAIPGLSGTTDYIEFYNDGDSAVDMGGMGLSSSPAISNSWTFAANTPIHPKGFLVIQADSGALATSINAGFGLSASGDKLYLFDKTGKAVDSVVFGIQAADYSLGRSQVAGGVWGLNVPTPGTANKAATLGDPNQLKINEWMANPASGKEWFELYNPDTKPVALYGLYLTDNLTKPSKNALPAFSFMGTGPNAYLKFIADDTTTNGATHVNFKISKDGEDLALFSTTRRIHSVTFGVQALGVSQGLLPDGATGSAVSFPITPTPEARNYLPLTSPVINEILSHTDLPLEDALELYNPTDKDISIAGWFLSNSDENFKKYKFPTGAVVPAHGYYVAYEYQFGNTNSPTSFTFNSSEGDYAYLSVGDAAGNVTGMMSWAKVEASANGISFGRYTNSVGVIDFVGMKRLTFGSEVASGDPVSWIQMFRAGQGAANSAPLVGPIVISEIMYYPPAIVGTNDNTQDEYVELLNITSSTQPLYNPLETTNTWHVRGGIDFIFPMDVTLTPGSRLLVVNFDPSTNAQTEADFRSKFNVPATVSIFGPYSGKLANSGETVKLEKPDPIQGPDHPNFGFVPYILVDRVDYMSSTAWPLGADGKGSSLQRVNAFLYGNEPTNWFAASPTAGRPGTGGKIDQDADGIPDDWELQYGFDPFNAADAAWDKDGDGLTNLQEYQQGTDPLVPNGGLKFLSIQKTASAISLKFNAGAGAAYAIEYKTSLSDAAWVSLQEFSAQSEALVEEAVDASVAGGQARFYRLIRR